MIELMFQRRWYFNWRSTENTRKIFRGKSIGIIDVVSMFGVGAYRNQKKIRLVVELEKWVEGKSYDRLGLTSKTIKYFDTEIP